VNKIGLKIYEMPLLLGMRLANQQVHMVHTYVRVPVNVQGVLAIMNAFIMEG